MASFKAETGRDRLRIRGKKKIIVPIHSSPTRNREFQKNPKNEKTSLWHLFNPKRDGTGRE